MAEKLWKITIGSLFPNDHQIESVYEGRHANEAAARDAALRKAAVDTGGSTIATIVNVEEIG